MNFSTALVLLFLAAVFEAGGDAVIRLGLTHSTFHRAMFFLAGAVMLFAYGWVVNAPRWDFGSLLGLYVVFFFVIAQLLSRVVFHQRLSAAVMLGGAFIVTGGVIISWAQLSK